MPGKKKNNNNATFEHFDPVKEEKKQDFRNLVLDAACCFVDRKAFAANTLRISVSELDELCMKEFGMSSNDLFNLCQSQTDIKVRKRLQELAFDGNSYAIDVYTKYIANIQKEQADSSLRIAVVSLPQSQKKDDDEDDGGVHRTA